MNGQSANYYIRNLFFWIASSLVAIVLLESNVMLGLAAGFIGGIALGALLFLK